MKNLYILTEERAKKNVIATILEEYSKKFNKNIINKNTQIVPIIENNIFKFYYKVKGVSIEEIDSIYIYIVSGYSSFVDYMIFEQGYTPIEDENYFSNEERINNLIMLVEETKTSDNESRNTSVYQRSSKFAYASYFYPKVPKYMLYNSKESLKKPSDTNIFGTNLLLTQNVKIIGKNLEYYKKFKTIDELIHFKNNMRLPPKGNIPILINKLDENNITISGILSKPKSKGNIGHDPNIGAITSIAKTLRDLGWNKKITVTKHYVKQEKINKMKHNKFLSLAGILNINLEGVDITSKINKPLLYWHYEDNSEKIATIFIHLLSLNNNIQSIYENHAGCERGYFHTPNTNIPIPKKHSGNKIAIPDLILKCDKEKEIILIEGKQSHTLHKGLDEINDYDLLENVCIKKYYPNYKINRWITTYGNDIYQMELNKKVLFHLNKDGTYYLNKNAPKWIKNCFNN